MCLAIPVRVTEQIEEGRVRVQVGKGDTYMEISTLLLSETPRPGDYVIVHAGFALRTVDPAEAEESLKIFRQIAELNLNEGRDLQNL